MNSALRHHGVRLWGTIFLCVFLSLWVLPWWQQAWGVQWLVAPVAVILVGAYFGLGWVMNRAGLLFLKRRFKEAAVWERAGLDDEVGAVIEQAAALFDSFWLSPHRRNAVNQWVSSRVAGFHLSRPAPGVYSRSILAAHLIQYPGDEGLAESWLDHQLKLEMHLPEEFEAAAAIGDALADLSPVQWRLFQLYLNDGRTDFNALKTYQRVWTDRDPLPDKMVTRLARLLRDRALLSDWCFKVYIQAYEAGELACLEGIAAAARWLPETIDNADDLAGAGMLVADLSPEQLEALTAGFKDHQRPATEVRNQHPLEIKDVALFLDGAIDSVTKWGQRAISGTGRWLRTATVRPRRPAALWRACLGSVGLVVLAWILWVWHPWRVGLHESGPLHTPPSVETLAPITTDPFTIQVAAYLKSEDAEGYVQQLKADGLDAFWTRAASANRVWYQVKVSHFPTKAQAQQYGDQLKSKGLIDDFYVANYSQQKDSGPNLPEKRSGS